MFDFGCREMRKYRKCLLLLLVWLALGSGFAPVCSAQKAIKSMVADDNVTLVPYRVGDKWGLSDTSGTIVLAPQYDRIQFMGFGLFRVKKGKYYGVADKYGRIAVPIKYTEVVNFSTSILNNGRIVTGYTQIKKDGKQGLIDSTGRVISFPRYNYIGSFGNDLFVVATVYRPKGWKRSISLKGLWKDGKFITETNYDIIEWMPSGNIRAKNFANEYTLLNKDGKTIVPLTYGFVSDISEGVVVVITGSLTDQKFKSLKIIRENGSIEFNNKYDQVRIAKGSKLFSEGLAAVGANGKIGFIDANGNTVIDFIYDDATPIQNGISIVKKEGKWGIINKQGTVVEPLIYKELKWRENKKNIIIGTRFNGEVDLAYFKSDTERSEFYYHLGNPSDGRINVCSKRGCGFINLSGKEVIPLTTETTYGSDFREGLIWFSKENTTGFIDTSGKVAINLPPQIKRPTASHGYFFAGGAAMVHKDSAGYLLKAYINKTGRRISPFKRYSGQHFTLPEHQFSSGYGAVLTDFYVKDDSRYFPLYSIIDTTGNSLSDTQFTDVSIFDEGIAIACKELECGIINSRGKLMTPLQYRFKDYRNQTIRNNFLFHGYLLVLDPNDPNEERVLGYMSKTGKKYWQD